MKLLVSLVFAMLLTISVSLGQGTYTTDWVGNTDPTNANHVGNGARSMWVDSTGVVYTSSMWDENGRNIGLYQNGATIGAMGGTAASQGSAIGGDTTSVFVALQNPFSGYVGRYNRISKAQDLKFQVSTTNPVTSITDVITGIADYNGTLLYISDYPGNRVCVYSTAGVLQRTFAVTQPGAIAVEPGGAFIWVAQQSTGKLRRYSSTGTAGTIISMAATARPSAMYISAAVQMWVGDQGPDQNIKIYSNLAGTPTLASTYGVTGGYLSSTGGTIGQTGSKRFTRVAGIGMDSSGNVYVLNNPWGGTWDLGRNGKTDIHCYNNAGTLVWQEQALNFEGVAMPDEGTNGVDLYSGEMIFTGSGGGGQKANTVNPFKYPTDPRLDATNGDRGFEFGQLAYVSGFRILLACGQNPDAFYTYYFNAATDGYVAIPWTTFGLGGTGNTRIRNGFGLDTDGNVWLSFDKSNLITEYPLTGFNANGSPVWGAAVTTATPASIAPLNRMAYLPDTDTMVLDGGSTTWTTLGNRVEVYYGWQGGNRTPNQVITLSRAQGKSLAVAGNYLFVGYYAIPNVDVFDLTNGTLVTTLVSNNTVFAGNDTDSMYGVRAFLKSDGTYMVTKDDYNGSKVVIYRWTPPFVGPSFHTTNVINTNSHTLVQATSTGTANQTDSPTFATNVATAYTNHLGGVVTFDVAGDALTTAPSIVAQYGGSKTLTIGVTANSALETATLQPTSGTTGAINCLTAPNSTTDPNLGDMTFSMGAITGGVANEKVTSFGFTFLTQTVLNGISVTVTAHFSDSTTSVVTRAINRNTTSPTVDTFFGFVAPSGKSITSVMVVSNTSRAETTHIDDVGFVTAAVP